MTRLQDAIGRLADRLIQQDGRSVDYQQGESTVVSGITAVPTDEEYKVFDGDGGFVQVQSTDWIFRVSDLAGVAPRPGDEVTEIRAGVVRKYQVMPIDKRPCCEDHDNAGVMVVVHSKRIQ